MPDLVDPPVSELVVMIGPSGSGKSTWLEQRFTKTQIVCLDTLRGWLTDDDSNQEVNPEAVDLRARTARTWSATPTATT